MLGIRRGNVIFVGVKKLPSGFFPIPLIDAIAFDCGIGTDDGGFQTDVGGDVGAGAENADGERPAFRRSQKVDVVRKLIDKAEIDLSVGYGSV